MASTELTVLLVEDEDRSARQTAEVISDILPDATIEIATNRSDAERVLLSMPIDLVVCDLRIPPSPGHVGADVAHGQHTHTTARELLPGVPTILLSALATRQNTGRQAELGGTQEAFGLTALPMTQVADKGTDDLSNRLGEIQAGLETLRSCTVEGSVDDPLLARAIQMYGAYIGSHFARADIRSGKSGALTAFVHYEHVDAGPADVVVKVGSRADIQAEAESVSRLVASRLPPGSFAPVAKTFFAGLRDRAAIVSTLAAGSESLFEALTAAPLKGVSLINSVVETLAPLTGAVEQQYTLGDLRGQRVSDARVRETAAEAERLLSFDSLAVGIERKLSHGDLHGDNVLLDPSGRPVLIDFADVGPAPAPIDLVTLELSLYMHPHGPTRDDQLDYAQWADLDAFVGSSQYASTIRACRERAITEFGEQAVFAVAYAHALRQLKYDDTDHYRAELIALSALSRLLS